MMTMTQARPNHPASIDAPVLVRQAPGSRPDLGFSQVELDRAGGDAIELTRSLVSEQADVFTLGVSGNSMRDAFVNDGDIVVLAATQNVLNGDLIAVQVTGENGPEATMLKHYYRENGHVHLQPARPDMLPSWYDPGQVTIQGKVVLISRQIGRETR